MVQKAKMIIADDSQTSRLIMYEEFNPEYEVLSANNGDECYELLEKNPDAAIVILDLLMPKSDGFTVLNKMSKNEKFSRIPIIAITGSDRNDDLIDALDRGAFDVMAKPVNMPLLRHKVGSLLERTRKNNQLIDNELTRKLNSNIEIDEKTGIYNKRTFCRKTRDLLNDNPNKKFVIIRFDIDGFKVLNDVYGVSECDRLLKAIGDQFRRILPVGDNHVYGRWEADHFVICMDIESFHHHKVAERVTDRIEGFFDIDTTIRMGIYVIEDPSIDVSLMCDRAYLALKSVKNSYQRHIAFFDDSMRKDLIEKQQIINEMRGALDGGQFVVYFQPQYNYASKTLHGAEALVRWKHPEKGIIPPFKFIPVFEENGFITHLDQFVWEEVCKYQRKWLDEGYEIVPVSVNVSRTDICSLRLAEYFSKLVAKYSLPTSAIRIEITESAYIDNPGLLIASVNKLRERGFSVEMDDFGSGYSSLNTLKDVHVDLLKLDMKFIEDEGDNSRGGSILSSVVRMSSWLKLPVLAEGVETVAQAEYLKSIGCVYMQGYFFAKPMPAEEYEKLIIENSKELVCESFYNEKSDFALQFLSSSNQATLLFNSFVGGAAIIEFDGEVVEAVRINDKFFEIIDSSREDYMSRCSNLLDGFEKMYQDKFIKTLRKAVETQNETACEMCSKTVCEGQEVWTRARVRLLVSNVDKYLFYLTIENISQRMNLLINNMRLTEQLTTIINNVPGGIADYEIASADEIRLVYFNDRLAQLFGYSREEFAFEYHDAPLKGVYPDDLENVQIAVASICRGLTNSTVIRVRHICSDGSWKWVELMIGKTRRRENLVCVSATITDIDERIKAEQKAALVTHEAEKKQKLLDALFEHSPYGIVQVIRLFDNYEFNSCNTNAWKLLKYDSKEHFVNTLNEKNFRFEVAECDETVEEIHREVMKVIEGPDGGKAEFNVSIMDAHGEPLKVHNVTQKIIFNNEVEFIQYLYLPIE